MTDAVAEAGPIVTDKEETKNTNGGETAVNGAEGKPSSQDTQEKIEPGKETSKETSKEPAGRDRSAAKNKKPDSKGRNNVDPHEGKGNRTDYSSLPESSDPKEIRKQVEFYFSDANLARDKFLFEQVGGSKNKPVPIATLHSFKRMRRFQPLSAVVAALKESSTLDVVDDDASVQRKVPFAVAEDASTDQAVLQKKFEDAALARSVYVKGFGDEQPTTQFDIEAFFAPYGPTNQVRLRRNVHKTFKGSVFVEFDSEETAKAFLAKSPPPAYNGVPLQVAGKKAYLEAKDAEMKQQGRKQGKDDDRDWRVRRDEDAKRGFRDGRRGGRGGRGGHSRGGRDHGSSSRDDRRDRHGRSDKDADKKRDRDEDEGSKGDPPAKRARSKSAEKEGAE